MVSKEVRVIRKRAHEVKKEYIDKKWAEMLEIKTHEVEGYTEYNQYTGEDNRLGRLAKKLKGKSMSSEDDYSKAATAAENLQSALETAKDKFDRAFSAWVNEVDALELEVENLSNARKRDPKKNSTYQGTLLDEREKLDRKYRDPHGLIKAFQEQCECAKKEHMPIIEKTHSRMEDFWVWLQNLGWGEKAQSTREVTQAFKKQYDAIAPASQDATYTKEVGSSSSSSFRYGGDKES